MSVKKIIFSLLIVVVSGFVVYSIFNDKSANENQKDSMVVENKTNYAQSIDSLDDPFLGDTNAKIVLVEFADFECPYCQQEFSTIRELANLFPQIKIIFRDLPLVSIHNNALSAAVAANCAHKQNKFWAFHDQLFINQNQLSENLYNNIATRLGLDEIAFKQCLANDLVKDEISKDANDANKMAVKGTPTFFLNGKMISGVITLEVWQQIINAALSSTK